MEPHKASQHSHTSDQSSPSNSTTSSMQTRLSSQMASIHLFKEDLQRVICREVDDLIAASTAPAKDALVTISIDKAKMVNNST